MCASGLLKRKAPVNPRPQLSTAGRRQRLQGVIPLLRIRLANDHPKRPAQRQPTPGDALDVKRGPRARRVPVQPDTANAVRGRVEGGSGD
jgi:hypothetical protein